MSRNFKICILSERAYHSIANKDGRNSVGGAEIQMAILAKEFAKRSHEVSFVTFEKSRSSFEEIHGIKIYNPFDNRGSGYTYLNIHNIYKLFKILKNIDADVYIQRGTSPLTGVLAFFARLNNKIFLYSVSSDQAVAADLLIKGLVDLKKFVYQFGVKNCDYVVCQTNQQKNLLKQTIGRKGKLIKNIYLPPKIENNKNDTPPLKILWVGRLIVEKRPELFLRLAKFFPNVKFYMIGGLQDSFKTSSDYYNKIKRLASVIKNLDFISYVPHNEINKYYAESAVLINTSTVEGFPNTYLEAWGNYTPVITLDFDPDEIICTYKLGLHSKTFEKMVEDVKTLLKDDKLRKEMGINSRKYVEKKHDINKIVNEYEDLIESLIRGGS
jgi:glycosyltransferase involved in cell wall biosynthesis